MLTAILPGVRAALPSARIGILGRPFLKPILAPHADVWLTGDARGGTLGFRDAVRAIKSTGPWSTTILCPNSWRSLLEAFMGGARKRVGYARDGRGAFLSVSVPRREPGKSFKPVYMAEYYARLFRAAGVDVQTDGKRPSLPISTDEQLRFDAWAATGGLTPAMKVLGVNPGASFGASKCWTFEGFAGAINTLVATGEFDRAVILSGPGERAIVEAILALLTPLAREKTLAPLDPPLPLDLLKPAVARCAVLLTNDTGPRHFAVAADVPCVTVMGPTFPAYTSTPVERGEVLRVDVPCGPCHKPICPLPPGVEHHQCMTKIGAARAVDAVRKAAL
jgi:heptosyltransferase-2